MILSDEEKILQATLRKFVADQIKPFAQKMDQCEEFSWGCCEGLVPFDTLEECINTCE